jgi:hypothetical protein
MKAGSKISGNTGGNDGGGGGVYVNSGTFTMSGGTISGNTSRNGGGGVYVGSNGTFTMSGGTISGNTASPWAGGGGGGVYVHSSGTFTMKSGEISGNSSSSYDGGGGGVYAGGTFAMSGGAISGNTAYSSGGGVYVDSGSVFTKDYGGVIYGADAADSLKNTSEYGHAVYVSSGSIERNTTAWEGVRLDSEKDGAAGGWVESMPSGLSLAESLAWINGIAAEGGVYVITIGADESLAPTTIFPGGKNVSITLQGDAMERTVSLSTIGSLFEVGRGVTLTLGNNVTLQGRADNTVPLVLINSGGTLVMKAGSKISGNTSSSGGGV